jgi:acyl-coenzyme A synthetase/AMP-(fatty) acid ligase
VGGLGIKQGETVVVIAPRVPEWWEIATACLRSGLVLCPCTTLLVAKDIEYRLQISHAAVFIGDEVSVRKCLQVRRKGKCPALRCVIQIGGSMPESVQGEGEGVVDFHDALSKIPGDAHFPVSDTLTPTSPALTFFTSGTTGPPKMVLHTQISYPLAHALTGMHWLRLSPTSVYWNLSEQGWAKAAWALFAAWNCGAALFVHDDRLAFEPRRTVEVLNRFPITTLCAPPTVYRQLVLQENRGLLKSKVLTHCCGAGEPLNKSVIEIWKGMTTTRGNGSGNGAEDEGEGKGNGNGNGNGNGIEIWDAYGQTETIVVCANQAAHPVRPGSMGKPIPGVPLVVLDAQGNITKNGEEGDIAIEMDTTADSDFFGMFEGYIDKTSGEIDDKITTFGNGKRFYITGDRATRDQDGYFWFVGRSDDVINSSGYRIGEFSLCHPAIFPSHLPCQSGLKHLAMYFFVLRVLQGSRYTDGDFRPLRSRIDSENAPRSRRVGRRRVTGPPARRSGQGLCRADRVGGSKGAG